MEEVRDSINEACGALFDGLRYIGDASYAIFPRDVAHSLGDLKKAFLTNVRDLIDCDINWISDRVAGGDKLREEWREKCKQYSSAEPPTDPLS